jgi:hypothetical protein
MGFNNIQPNTIKCYNDTDEDESSVSEAEIYINSENDDDSDGNRDEYEYGEQALTITDAIAADEEQLDCEKVQGQYYLGNVYYYKPTGNIQVSTTISVQTLYKYDMFHIRLYLYDCLDFPLPIPELDIIQIYITPEQEYCAVVKTFWLRMVQLAWKKQFAKKQQTLQLRNSIYSQQYFASNGKYPQELQELPGLRGMLAVF